MSIVTQKTLDTIRRIVNSRTSIGKDPFFARLRGIRGQEPKGRIRGWINSKMKQKIPTGIEAMISKELKNRAENGKFFVDCVVADISVDTKSGIFLGRNDMEELLNAVAQFPPLANDRQEVFLCKLREFFDGDNVFTLRLMALLSCYGICFLETQTGIGVHMSPERVIEEGMVAIRKNKEKTLKLGIFETAWVFDRTLFKRTF